MFTPASAVLDTSNVFNGEEAELKYALTWRLLGRCCLTTGFIVTVDGHGLKCSRQSLVRGREQWMFFTVFKSEEEAGEEAGWTVALRQRVEMRPMMGMVYVYILESESPVGKTYVGFTHDLKARFAAHNRGESPYTAKCRPWKLMAYVAVRTGAQAVALERYFKSGSGTAFWKKRLCWKAASVPEDPPEPKA